MADGFPQLQALCLPAKPIDYLGSYFSTTSYFSKQTKFEVIRVGEKKQPIYLKNHELSPIYTIWVIWVQSCHVCLWKDNGHQRIAAVPWSKLQTTSAICCFDSPFCLVSLNLSTYLWPLESILPLSYKIMSTTGAQRHVTRKEVSQFSVKVHCLQGLNKISLQSPFWLDKRSFIIVSQVESRAFHSDLLHIVLFHKCNVTLLYQQARRQDQRHFVTWVKSEVETALYHIKFEWGLFYSSEVVNRAVRRRYTENTKTNENKRIPAVSWVVFLFNHSFFFLLSWWVCCFSASILQVASYWFSSLSVKCSYNWPANPLDITFLINS